MITLSARLRNALGGVVLLLAAPFLRAADPTTFVPFVIPAQPDPQALAAYPPAVAIAPQAPRVVARDGHFFSGPAPAARIKFWSVNLTFDTCFPTHEAAVQLALRLSQGGINCVRLHHMDMFTWAQGRGIWDGADPRKLSAEALDRLDYLLDQLAQHGIYADLNLHVSRTHSHYVGLPAVPELNFDKIIDVFTPQLVAAQQDYARQLLGHVNAYRHVRWADDSAVAIVEINNEDGLFMWGAMEKLRVLPEPYAGILQGQFNAWLQRRYGSTEKLHQAWGQGALPLGTNLLVDGDFKDLTAAARHWPLETHEGSVAKLVRSADGTGGRVQIDHANATNWHIQFQQRDLKVQAGQYYTVTFVARADQPRPVSYGLSQTHDPWKNLGLQGSARLTAQWRPFRTGFVATADDAAARLSFLVGGTTTAVEFKDVQLCPGGRLGLADDETLETGRVALFGPGQTAARVQDLWHFLADTDKGFWDKMYAFVKHDMNCQAMVTGTIVFGPLGLWGQSGMDFVDSHAYWNHPQFPGRPWDGGNWQVAQTAMIDHPESATLFRMAGERLAGKPFTVTEYNHAAPNDYQAEGVPEIAAFAAAQDWDGVWLFDYGQARDHVTGYFEIGPNPAKWGFMAAGAAIFRGGALGPLEKARVIPLAPAVAQAPELLWSWHDKYDRDMPSVIAAAAGLHWPDLLGARLYVALDGAVVPPEKPAGTSLTWAQQDKTGTFVALGSGAMVWIGRAKASASLVTLHQPAFAALVLAAVDGQPFSTTRKLLLSACGRCENTGMIFSADRRTVGHNWGHGPVLIEPVTADVRLPETLAAGAWTIVPVGPDGRSLGAPQDVSVRGGAVLHLDGATPTMWYVMARK